jgi:carbon starvation protein
MVLEGFVSIAALTAACALAPGDYFKINLPTAQYAAWAETTGAKYHWDLAEKEFAVLEHRTNEKLAGRTGGGVTLAVGMAKVFSNLPGMKTLTSYWYHFVIMFEALFILTLLETGTRVARFVFQEAAGQLVPRWRVAGKPNWAMNAAMSVIVCLAWGSLLYIGNLNTLWKMLGISNQLLAAIALAVGTTYILLHSPRRIYALCAFIPFVFILAVVLTAGPWSMLDWWRSAREAPPGTPATDIFLLKLACVLAGIMLALTMVIAGAAARRWWIILRTPPEPAVRPSEDRIYAGASAVEENSPDDSTPP